MEQEVLITSELDLETTKDAVVIYGLEKEI